MISGIVYIDTMDNISAIIFVRISCNLIGALRRIGVYQSSFAEEQEHCRGRGHDR